LPIALAAALLAVPARAQQNQKCIVSHRGESRFQYRFWVQD
jgi:hypothetical protein